MATQTGYRGTLATAQSATGLSTDGVLYRAGCHLVIQMVGANTPVMTPRLAISVDGGTTFGVPVFDHNDVAAQAAVTAAIPNRAFVIKPGDLPPGAVVKVHITAYTSGDLTITYWMS